MILFGYGVSALGGLHQAGWLHGLKLAAVAVAANRWARNFFLFTLAYLTLLFAALLLDAR